MIIIKTIEALQKQLSAKKKQGKSIGFVPTMGALHKGHMALIQQCVAEQDITVSSVFVNPTQFNDKNDFAQYPITIEQDIFLLEQNGCDYLFLPSVAEIYPNGETLATPYLLGFIETILEGAFRPGHFQGVCQVVERLLRIVQPDYLYLGQKDFQQVMVIKKMLEITQLNTKVKTVATVREESGLAYSSRNERLSTEERATAAIISQSLQQAQKDIHTLPLEQIAQNAKDTILNNGFSHIDYFSFHKQSDLQAISTWDKEEKIVALFAGFIGGVRLIDNMLLN